MICPLQNSHSNARLTSLQSHHGPVRCGPLVLEHLAGGDRPARADLLQHLGDELRAAPRWTRRMPPHASSAARAMRQRRSGCSATGSSDASWPQYSNSRRGARWAARSSSAVSYGPEPAEQRQVVRALEHVDRVDLEQPDALEHAPQRAPVRRAARARGSAKPCAASATRRAWAPDRRSIGRRRAAGMARDPAMRAERVLDGAAAWAASVDYSFYRATLTRSPPAAPDGYEPRRGEPRGRGAHEFAGRRIRRRPPATPAVHAAVVPGARGHRPRASCSASSSPAPPRRRSGWPTPSSSSSRPSPGR